MNNRTNYTIVGLFVLLGFLSIAVLSYWMIRPTEETDMKKYVIYFNESVLGLNIDAPVKYRGITVGKVVKLEINPKNTEQIRVVIQVDKKTPIKTSTVAKLTAQGITGLTYINLSLGDKNSPLLTTVPPGEKYPVIKTVPSFFETFQTSLGSLFNKLTKTLDSVNDVLNAKSREDFAEMLQESAIFISKLNKVLDEKSIENFHKSMENLERITAQIDKTMPKVDTLVQDSIQWEDDIRESIQQIVDSYKEFENTSHAIDEVIKRGDFDLKSIADELIPPMTKSLNNLNAALNELRTAIKEYKNNPRDLLFKEVEVKKGPGEK